MRSPMAQSLYPQVTIPPEFAVTEYLRDKPALYTNCCRDGNLSSSVYGTRGLSLLCFWLVLLDAC